MATSSRILVGGNSIKSSLCFLEGKREDKSKSLKIDHGLVVSAVPFILYHPLYVLALALHVIRVVAIRIKRQIFNANKAPMLLIASSIHI